MKRIITTLALVAGLASATAGDYLTNTNQHVAFLRNPARNATLDIDAIYSNPAGMAFFRNGWQFSINAQSAYQTRTIHTTFAPFAANADSKSLSGTRAFRGKASAPVIPSLFAAYKTGRWTFGSHFALVGGGGKAKFGTGLPSFEAPVSLIPSLLSSNRIPASRYQYETSMQGRQYIFGVSLGAAYRLSEHLSAYVGARFNYVSNHYEGYVRNIQANIGGSMVNVSQTLAALATQYQTAAPAVAARLRAYSQATADKELNVDQSGWGITPIIGINYKLGALHLAAKYEFRTKLDIKNETSVNSTGVASFENGVNTPHDIPAMLSLGAAYSIIPELRISAGYHHFFDKQAGMAGDKQRTLKHGTHEYLLGVEADLNRRLTISAGGQITNYGLSDAFQQDLSFSCDSFSVGVGGAYRLTPTVKLNVAYFQTFYSDYKKASSSYNGTPLAGTDIFSRTNTVLGLGVDFVL